MTPLHVLVAEDEPLARRRLANFIKDRPNTDLVGTCGNGRDAVTAIREKQPDLVLLDVQMPEMNGLEVIEAVGADQMPAVIFVTAYDQYAIRAFEIHALDYLLKPFDNERLAEALDRAGESIHSRQMDGLRRQLLDLARNLQDEDPEPAAHASHPGSNYTNRIALKTSDRITLLKTEEIDWIEGAGVYVKLHAGQKTHLLRDTLKNLEENLDPTQFVRIHRSTIVNIDRIEELTSYFRGEYLVLLKDGTQLKLSRTYRDNLQTIIGPIG